MTSSGMTTYGVFSEANAGSPFAFFALFGPSKDGGVSHVGLEKDGPTNVAGSALQTAAMGHRPVVEYEVARVAGDLICGRAVLGHGKKLRDRRRAGDRAEPIDRTAQATVAPGR